MDVILYNQHTTQAENVTISALDDLRMLSEAYFGIVPEDQMFTVDGRPINMSSTLENVGLKSNDMVIVAKTDESVEQNESIFDVKEQMIVDNIIPYTLLYVSGETNDMAFRIIIDTGASNSVMSETLSKMLKINDLIDDRTTGVAVGIGNSKVLGTITGCNVKIGNNIFIPANFSVLEDSFDRHLAILGLDFLTSHRCKIDFTNRTIEVDGTIITFMNEMEVQNMEIPYNVLERKLSSGFNRFSDSVINKKLTLDLLNRIIRNILDNPNEEKFKKINTNSKMIKDLTNDMPLFLRYLLELGFKPDDVEKHRYSYNGPLEHLQMLDKKMKS